MNKSNNSSLNFIASVVSLNSILDENGTVKLAKVKICDDIEILIPNTKPSLSQMLSLNIYRKTGSGEVITDFHGMDKDCHILKLNF